MPSFPTTPCGPEYYEARRKAWLTPKHHPSPNSTSNSIYNTSTTTTTPSSSANSSNEDGSSRQRISDLLSKPGAVESEDIWNRGLHTLWRGLVSGSRFKRPLPLDIVIKILYAGWIRDGTWPAGATITDSPQLHNQLSHQTNALNASIAVNGRSTRHTFQSPPQSQVQQPSLSQPNRGYPQPLPSERQIPILGTRGPGGDPGFIEEGGEEEEEEEDVEMK